MHNELYLIISCYCCIIMHIIAYVVVHEIIEIAIDLHKILKLQIFIDLMRNSVRFCNRAVAEL